jgi:signal transduction histidine kinase
MQTNARVNGEFISRDFTLSQNGMAIGKVQISYFSPFFFSENDFYFLDLLNAILAVIGISSLAVSVIIGLFMAKRISDPIYKTAAAARRMADGDYTVRITERNNTDELNELTGSVNQLANSLGMEESLRKQLTADVSHELRTPLTAVQTHLEAMIDGLWEITPDRLKSCHEEIQRISGLVKDMEGLAKADSGKFSLNKKEISLAQIFSKVIDGFEIDIKKKNLSVTLDGTAPEIKADGDRIRQVAVNLIDNAVKYTQEGGHIQVKVSQTGEYAVFNITDNGIGIPEEELPFIFERFYRADKSRNRKTGGCGIGLAVVKAIVDAHRGKVEAESKPGEGSRFTVMLPFGV